MQNKKEEKKEERKLEKEIHKSMNNAKMRKTNIKEDFDIDEIEYDETIPEEKDLPKYMDYDD